MVVKIKTMLKLKPTKGGIKAMAKRVSFDWTLPEAVFSDDFKEDGFAKTRSRSCCTQPI